MSDRKAFILFWVMLAGLSGLVVQQYRAARVDERAAMVAAVQSTCDNARAEISGTSERECGDIQDRTGTEYLCKQAGHDFACWVEVK